MPTVLKTKKPKSRSQVKIYEHTENIEAVATKEFVRQELRPVHRDIKWLMCILASLVGIMIYLHGDTSKRMDRMEDKMDRMEKRMDGMAKRMDGIEKRMDGIEEKMGKIENKLDRLLQRK